jgi:hypothetical protein
MFEICVVFNSQLDFTRFSAECVEWSCVQVSCCILAIWCIDLPHNYSLVFTQYSPFNVKHRPTRVLISLRESHSNCYYLVSHQTMINRHISGSVQPSFSSVRPIEWKFVWIKNIDLLALAIFYDQIVACLLQVENISKPVSYDLGICHLTMLIRFVSTVSSSGLSQTFHAFKPLIGCRYVILLV